MASTERSFLGQLARFGSLPLVQELEAEAAKKIEEARRATAGQLAAFVARRTGDEALALSTARFAAEEAVQAAREKAAKLVAAAEARSGEARERLVAFEWQCDLEIHRLEQQLVETADPRISDLVEWCLVELNATMKAANNLGRVRTRRDSITDELVTERVADPDAGDHAEARLVALRKAIARAEALRLVGDVDVTAALEQIRATIPTFD